MFLCVRNTCSIALLDIRFNPTLYIRFIRTRIHKHTQWTPLFREYRMHIRVESRLHCGLQCVCIGLQTTTTNIAIIQMQIARPKVAGQPNVAGSPTDEAISVSLNGSGCRYDRVIDVIDMLSVAE